MAGTSNNMVNDSQSGDMGGGDKETGAHGENTHQVAYVRQLVIIARFKPAKSMISDADVSSAAGLVGKVTGAVEKGIDAAESAMASIPGLQMLIKEDKKDSPSEKEYKYDYKEWNSKIPKMDADLKKLFPENEVAAAFEFSENDTDGIKKAANKLFNTVLKPAVSSWNKYKVYIHLIGIGQGGSVINEVSQLIAGDSKFKSEKWIVKSVFYVGSPIYSGIHLFDKACMKSEGDLFHFNSFLDFTQQITSYYAPQDDFLKFITESNSNTISMMVGKIKLSMIKILSIVLSGLSIGTGDDSAIKKFDLLKSEIEDLVKNIISIIKKLASNISSFIDPGKLPDFATALSGFDSVPGKSVDRLQKFVSDFGDQVKDQVKSANVSLGPQDAMKALNCLCPLLDQIALSISLFDYKTETTNAMIDQIINQSGIKEIYGKGKLSGTQVELKSIGAPFLSALLEKYKTGEKKDQLNQLLDDCSKIPAKIDKESIKISELDPTQKVALSTSLYSITEPMILSKKKVLAQLQDWLSKLKLDSFMKDISANKLFSFPGGLLSKAHLSYDTELEKSIAGVDSQMDRLKSFFKKHDYAMSKDTLHFIFNIHNQVINQFHEDIHYQLDQQTGFLDFMHSRGCDNQFVTTGKNTYNPDTAKEDDKLIITKKLPENA